MYIFKNEIVTRALYEAGWNLNRKIDKDYIKSFLKSKGYPIIESAIIFLESFGNLIIRFNNLRNGLFDDINLDIEHAVHVENSERIFEDYFPRVKKKLCLIGSAYRDYFCLVMASDGSVYGGYSDSFYKISDTGIGAIEAIILDYDFEEIP